MSVAAARKGGVRPSVAVVFAAVLAVAVAGCGGYQAGANLAAAGPGATAKDTTAADKRGAKTGGEIQVTGRGSVTVEPDLALLELGVEARAETVKEARAQAAEAMTQIVEALKRLGIADTDIQTRAFSIFPLYDYLEETDEEGRRKGREVLAGYRVANQATVKVRDTGRVGEAIDAAAQAGGDATRINNVRFTVEDTGPYLARLRELAVEDALTKAGHYATLADVTLGPLMRLQEAGSPFPASERFASVRLEAEAAFDSAPTPVAGGELELALTIHTVFATNND